MSEFDFTLKDYALSVPAGGQQNFLIEGNEAVLVSATGTLYIKFDDRSETLFVQGFGYRARNGVSNYRKVSIINKGGAAVTGTVMLGYGEVRDQRLNVTAPLQIQTLGTISPTADVVIPAGGTAQIIAANAGRKKLVVTNKVSNTQILRIGDATTAAAVGLELPPGGVFSDAFTGALYAYNPGAAAESVTVAELS